MHQIFQQNNYDICQFFRHLSMTRRYACQSSVCLFQGGRKPKWWHHFNGKPWDTRNGYHRWAGRTGGVLLHGLSREQGMMGMISEPNFCWLYPCLLRYGRYGRFMSFYQYDEAGHVDMCRSVIINPKIPDLLMPRRCNRWKHLEDPGENQDV
jgi:hypothetical protein